MGAGVFDIVMGVDGAVVNLGYQAVWSDQVAIAARAGSSITNVQFSGSDASGDNWTFALQLGTPSIALKPSGSSSVPFELTVIAQVAATDTSNAANGFSEPATLTCPGVASIGINLASELDQVTIALMLRPADATMAVAGNTGKSQLLTQNVAMELASYLVAFMPTLALPLPGMPAGGQMIPLQPAPAADTSQSGSTVLLFFASFAGAATPPDPGTATWPAGGMFLACKPDLSAVIAPVGVVHEDTGRYSITSYWFRATVGVGFDLELLGADTGAGPNAVSIPVHASGPCDYTVHTPDVLGVPVPNVSFDGTFDADGHVNGTLAVAQSGAAIVASITLVGVNLQVSFDVSIPYIGAIPDFSLPLGTIGDMVSGQISEAASSALSGTTYSAAAMLPGYSTANYMLSLGSPVLTEISGPGGVRLLGLTAASTWGPPE